VETPHVCRSPAPAHQSPDRPSIDHHQHQHQIITITITNWFDFDHGEIVVHHPTDGGYGNGIGYQPSSFIIVVGGGIAVESFVIVSAFVASVEFIIIVVVVVADIKSATEPCITTIICRV